MGKIVAIGGGEINLKETFLIDEFIVDFSEKPNPKLLFIPTASADSQTYADTIQKVYGEKLKCSVDVLNLINSNLSPAMIKYRILTADIIYVGGGDTLKMLEIWRSNYIDNYLFEAYHKNIVLAGISAGSICWFLKGHSESDEVYNSKGNWDTAEPTGIGIIPAIHCPHYNEKGSETFDKSMKSSSIPGIAIDNNCAFVIMDDKYRIIKSDPQNKVFLFNNIRGVTEKKELVSEKYKPLTEIFL
ncbi:MULTISPECIES: Type 1 glutamine amidotransferase-like domain-containing protein [Peribacillus]|uniref:Type 1 glutamine amidotransferase-like domain-containing protein n=1 Tax=Peribacillus TaxID=2675229 RepID=UPI00119ED4C2|nr:Type 1 glutamine amidotransferase-like domain-containing protein [Peribacillus simplex]